MIVVGGEGSLNGKKGLIPNNYVEPYTASAAPNRALPPGPLNTKPPADSLPTFLAAYINGGANGGTNKFNPPKPAGAGPLARPAEWKPLLNNNNSNGGASSPNVAVSSSSSSTSSPLPKPFLAKPAGGWAKANAGAPPVGVLNKPIATIPYTPLSTMSRPSASSSSSIAFQFPSSLSSSSVTKSFTSSSSPSSFIPYARPGPINILPDRVQENHQLLSFTSAAINTDHTNRKDPVRGDKINSILNDLLTRAEYLNNPSFVSITEWSTLNIANAYQKTSGYQGVAAQFSTKSDISQSLWNDAWQPVLTRDGAIETDQSFKGKYIRSMLEHQPTGRRLAFFTVHLPHKGGRQLAMDSMDLLLKAICDLNENRQNVEVDGCVVAGDFNRTPELLKEQISKIKGLDLRLQLTEDSHHSTIETNTFKDNVLFSDGIESSGATVFNNLKLFTHYPILAAGNLQLC